MTKKEKAKNENDVPAPSQEQIEAFARRLMPEIKKLFANEEAQKEFLCWKIQRADEIAQ